MSDVYCLRFHNDRNISKTKSKSLLEVTKVEFHNMHLDARKPIVWRNNSDDIYPIPNNTKCTDRQSYRHGQTDGIATLLSCSCTALLVAVQWKRTKNNV